MRKIGSKERKVLKDVLYNATVSDMRQIILWAVEDTRRFDYLLERILDGVSFTLAFKEAEYL